MKKMMLLLFSVFSMAILYPVTAGAAEDQMIAITEENFPDTAFRIFVEESVDGKEADGMLSSEEIESITSLNLKGLGIADLTGIGYFQNLMYLRCQNNELTTIYDYVKDLPKLKEIDCSNNKLEGILDLSGLETLTDFSCKENLLTEIILNTSNPYYELDVRYNRLESKKNVTAVEFATVDTYAFYPQGEKVYVEISEENFPDEVLREYVKTFDLDEDGYLYSEEIENETFWSYSGNEIIRNYKGIEYFAAINKFQCSFKDVEEIPALPDSVEVLMCSYNKLQSLPELPDGIRVVECEENQLTALPELPDTLEEIYCYNNKIEYLPELPENLEIFYCYENAITNMPELPAGLQDLRCSDNQLTQLPELPENLEILHCVRNQLTSLSKLPEKMETLLVAYNDIQGILDASAAVNLRYMEAQKNQLTGVILNTDAEYDTLDISYNQMTSLSDVVGAEEQNWQSSYRIFCPQGDPDTWGHLLGDKYFELGATFTKNGAMVQECEGCDIRVETVIPKVQKPVLSYTRATYNGKLKTPKVTVKDAEGNLLTEGEEYTVTYGKGRKKVGRYSVKVTLDGYYQGSQTVYFTIVPKAPESVSATLYGYNDVKVQWDKVENASGYYVYYKTSSEDSYKSYNRTTKTYLKKENLKSGKKYMFKVVPYYYNESNDTRYKSLVATKDTIYTLKKIEEPVISKSGTKVNVTWKNISGETGYQISQSTTESAKKVVVTYKTTKGTEKTVTAEKGKKYYYRVRAYKTVNGTKIYGPWSNAVAYKRK